jgi:aryl-alcohol dehydrogenase-like predicted oxidoreductase
MKRRGFGNTDLSVSPITFGAWSIGGPALISGKPVGWSGVDDSTSIDALQTAFDLGINMFDTADAYAKGHSEDLIGRALSSHRHEIYISTKVGLVDSSSSDFLLDFSREHILQSCEGSLKRLKTEYIDIYLLHMVVDGYPLTEEIKETMEGLKKQGKIRHYGVSVQLPKQGMEQLQKDFGDSMMMEYNMLTSPEAEDVIALASQKGTGIITRGALAKGLLAGSYRVGHRFPENDVRSRLPGEYIDKVLHNVEVLKTYAQKQNTDLLSISLAYQFQNDGCNTVTVGLKAPKQVREIVHAAEAAKDYDWTEIKRILREGFDG